MTKTIAKTKSNSSPIGDKNGQTAFVKTDASETVSRILSEDVLSLAQARTELQNLTGIRPDKATMTRWIHKGVGGVKLEAIRLGGRSIFTSMQALNRFIEARTRSM
jgi:hypothetical protein